MVDGHEHVGTMLASNEKVVSEYMKKRTSACKRPGHAIMAIGSKQAPITPITASKLYWSVCISRLCYGLEIMHINGEVMDTLESYHSEMAKVVQGLPENCSNIGSIATVGWLPMSHFLDLMSLMFLWRLITKPASCLYMQILLYRFCCYTMHHGIHRGPLCRILNTCKKYDILFIVQNTLQGHGTMLTSEWSKIVKTRIWDNANLMYKATLPLYKSLTNIKLGVASIGIHSWWKFTMKNPLYTKNCRCIMKMLLGTHGLKTSTYRFTSSNDVLCDNCELYHPESIDHVLFECSQNRDTRARLWQAIIEHCPPAMVKDLHQMSNRDKTRYFLNALYCDYTPEWNTVYVALCQFMSTLYKDRLSLK